MKTKSQSGHVVLDETIDEDYAPTDQEVTEYAVWLGMDPESDKDLFWIAREGLKAPLPSPWKPCQSEDNEIFYFNFETGESVWDHPCDEHYRKLFQEEKARRDMSKDNARSKRQVSFDLHAVSMELPAPGESLFGKHSQRNLVFEPKDRQRTASSSSFVQEDKQRTESSPSSAQEASPARKPSLGPLRPPRHQATCSSDEASPRRCEAPEVRDSSRPEVGESEVMECSSLRLDSNEPEVMDCCADWGRPGELRRELEARWRGRLQDLEQGIAQDIQRERAALESRLSADVEARTRQRIEREVDSKLRVWAADLELHRRAELERELEERLSASSSELEERAREKVQRRLEAEAEAEARQRMPEFLRRARAKLEEEAEEMVCPAMADYRREAEIRLRRQLEEELRPRLEAEAAERLGSSLSELERAAREGLERRVEERLELVFSSLEQEARAKFKAGVELRLQRQRAAAEQPPAPEPVREAGGSQAAAGSACSAAAPEAEEGGSAERRQQESPEPEVAAGAAKGGEAADELDGMLERLGEDLESFDAPGLIDTILERLEAGPRPVGASTAEAVEEAAAPCQSSPSDSDSGAESDSESESELEDEEEEIPEEIQEELEEEGAEDGPEGSDVLERRARARPEELKCDSDLEDDGDTRSNASAYTFVFEPFSPSCASSDAGTEIPEELPSPSCASEVEEELSCRQHEDGVEDDLGEALEEEREGTEEAQQQQQERHQEQLEATASPVPVQQPLSWLTQLRRRTCLVASLLCLLLSWLGTVVQRAALPGSVPGAEELAGPAARRSGWSCRAGFCCSLALCVLGVAAAQEVLIRVTSPA